MNCEYKGCGEGSSVQCTICGTYLCSGHIKEHNSMPCPKRKKANGWRPLQDVQNELWPKLDLIFKITKEKKDRTQAIIAMLDDIRIQMDPNEIAALETFICEEWGKEFNLACLRYVISCFENNPNLIIKDTEMWMVYSVAAEILYCFNQYDMAADYFEKSSKMASDKRDIWWHKFATAISAKKAQKYLLAVEGFRWICQHWGETSASSKNVDIDILELENWSVEKLNNEISECENLSNLKNNTKKKSNLFQRMFGK